MSCPKCGSQNVRPILKVPFQNKGNVSDLLSCCGMFNWLRGCGSLSIRGSSVSDAVKQSFLSICDSCGRKFKS
jgi:hypothetical protein